MLTVKTFLASSKINGIGLFAAEDIPKEKIVWEYFPLIDITYSAKKWNELKTSLNKNSFKMIQRYTYKENNCYILCTDNAQFMNHSKDLFNISNTEDLKSMYANRKILKNEELLCNYFDYSDIDDHHLGILNKKV